MNDHSTTTIDLREQSGLDLTLRSGALELDFGPGVAHPCGERRRLDDVRRTLADPTAQGPDHLYTIYMDIADEHELGALRHEGLLYGAVVYNHGAIGRERLRSQGHIHSPDRRSGLRYSEVYEFWSGHGHVYLQKECAPAVTRALLVPVGPGDKVVVPLGWVHLTVASADEVLSFGAWCARQNELEYELLRELGGPAHFVLADGGVAVNPRYESVAEVEIRAPQELPLLGIPADRPIYTAWREDPERFAFLARPELARDAWDDLD